MRPWFKRSLFGVAGLALVAASVGGCAYQHGWHGNPDEFRAKMVERVSDKLELDAAQKQKLAVLAQKMQAQREALRAGNDPRSQFRQLFAGDKLDQAGAARLIDEKTAAVKSGSPEVIAAAADFFDNLRPDQQQKVRDFMDRRGRGHWGRHG
ncbi:MAG: Spy/CpxP family protein refolding chaperone [Proteobacteria bacterium]|nr:Spy/CpxP family protein refolding chaperone [Pseudomonadota bacterium]